MKLAKTIRLDASDTHVFDRPAELGDWAITGTFSFVDSDPTDWSGKQQVTFRTAWLGIGSFGHSTFVQVTEISAPDYEQALHTLAEYLAENYDAPSLEAATRAAGQEIDDMAGLCDHPTGTLLAMERAFSEQNITEKASVLTPSEDLAPAITWTVDEDK